MRVWRLCRRKHAAFDGEGARLAGGRWNRRGTAVVYTSATLSLAALEYLVHLDAALAPTDLVAVAADVPDTLPATRLEAQDLPRDWRGYPAAEALADLGSDWAAASRTAVLSVPSAVVPHERNILLNPAHADFRRVRVLPPERFSFDRRIFKAARSS
jgi:RES domain-containing protein